MKPFRFLHAADLHLDSPYKGLSGLPASVLERIRESSFAALGRLIELAVKEKVDFVLVSGDVYDLADRSLRAQLRFQQAAKRLSESRIPLYIIHGNHDPLQGQQAGLAWPDSVVVFGGQQVETVAVTDREGDVIAQINGVSYLRSATTDNWAERFPKPDRSRYAIAMLHTNVDGDLGHGNYAPCSKDKLVRSGYDYWALGHIHSRRVLHEAPFIVYPGNIQGRSIRETGAKGCYIVDVDSTGHTSLRFHETSVIRWESRTVSIQGMANEQQLKQAFEQSIREQLLQYPEGSSVVRFTLTGRGPLHRMLHEGNHLQELIDELRAVQVDILEAAGSMGAFVWIESCKVRTGADTQIEALLSQESFIGDLIRLAEDLLGDDESREAFLREALAPLLNNAKAARLLADLTSEQYKEWLMNAREIAIDELLGGEGSSSA